MEYEYKKGQDRPHVYSFDRGWEIKAIRSAFSEYVTMRILRANASNVTSWESSLASFPRQQKIMKEALHRPQQISDILGQYYENTEQAMYEIAQDSSLPAFRRGSFIGERQQSGKSAYQLMYNMLEACARLEMQADGEVSGMSHEDQIQKFISEIPAAPPEDL